MEQIKVTSNITNIFYNKYHSSSNVFITIEQLLNNTIENKLRDNNDT